MPSTAATSPAVVVSAVTSPAELPELIRRLLAF
jgi:hypothetical protein